MLLRMIREIEVLKQLVGMRPCYFFPRDFFLREHLRDVERHLYEVLPNRSDEGLTLETSAILPFAAANLRFQH